MSDDSGIAIPPRELWFLRNVYIPWKFWSMTWESSRDLFLKETEKILDLVRGLSLDQMNHPIFVNRLMGLQESSRVWSAGMLLDHLNRMNRVVVQIIPALRSDKMLVSEFNADVLRPAPGHGMETLAKFDLICKEFKSEITNYVLREPSTLQFKHHWYGPLDQQQWMKVTALHMNLHRRQLELILKEVLKVSEETHEE